ncbi:glycosyltransferase [Ectothiorhodospiraceae bacterium 2226]|nr:glycosyltransferase [Ectothiorhodospiraceae bacterium 2226]
MTTMLEAYARVAGEDVIDHLRQLSEPLRGMKVVHINSTRVGGGVAEILDKLVPLMAELGMDTRWEVISGAGEFYHTTKSFHNGLQGNPVNLTESMLKAFEETNEQNAERLRPVLEEADVVFIHDPQPAPLLELCPSRRGKWIWRCHIDASHPYRPVWRYLRQWLQNYDASVFSLAGFAQSLPHPQYLIPPSIDPLSEKNMELPEDEVRAVFSRFNLREGEPVMVQISRFDRFKDPVGVVQAYRLAKRFTPHLQLVLAGGGASDDPEGEAVLEEVRAATGDDEDVHLLLLPPDAHRTINALQRAGDILLQKSLKEGFGLTVTEAMWKGKPVIAGDTGGIRLQVINHHTGFLVNTPEGAALRTRYFLRHPEKLQEMGAKAREFVRENFLLTRQLREYLTLMVGLQHGAKDRIELD